LISALLHLIGDGMMDKENTVTLNVAFRQCICIFF